MKPVTRAVCACIFFAVAPSVNALTTTATFQVLLTIVKSCTVSTGELSTINLGPMASDKRNIKGNSTFSVTCSKTTPYFIGLAPSVANGGDNDGNGAMVSVAKTSNTDKVPYQLHKNSDTGPSWGNTATSTTFGNGVGGTGTGQAQNYSVYAKVTNINYTPDSYADNVTVNVNY